MQPYSVFETTFIMLKPEVIERAIVGRVFQRFEDAGMNITSFKTTQVTKDIALRHYPYDKKWMKQLGIKTAKIWAYRKLEVKKFWGTSDPEKIGNRIWNWAVESITGKNITTCLIYSPHAVERVKQIAGATDPLQAVRGSIRGDFCTDSPIYSCLENRAIRNLIHRSTSLEDAKREIAVWYN